MTTTETKVRLHIHRGLSPRPAGRLSVEERRVEAVERLIALLEQSAFPGRPQRIPLRSTGTDTRPLLARLRAARAAYALSSGVVIRVSPGAWARSR